MGLQQPLNLADFRCEWLEKLVDLDDDDLKDLELTFDSTNIPVSRDNLDEYLKLYCENKFMTHDLDKTLDCLRDGINWFYGISGSESILSGFQAQDLEILLSGRKKDFTRKIISDKIIKEKSTFLENLDEFGSEKTDILSKKILKQQE